MRTVAVTLGLAGVLAFAPGCATPVLHRTSGDRSEEYLYLSPLLALWKAHTTRVFPNDPEWLYTLVQAHWLNEPELAASTGDTNDKTLINSVLFFGQSKSKGLLFGQGHDPDPQKWPNTKRFFILAYDRLILFKTEREMNACLLENWKVSSADMKPVAIFYEAAKKQSQGGPANWSQPFRSEANRTSSAAASRR